MKIRILSNKSQEYINYLLMAEKEPEIISDLNDQFDITINESELTYAEELGHTYYVVKKLIRNYNLIHINPYKSSLHSALNQLMQLDNMILKEKSGLKKKQFLAAKKDCLNNIKELEKLSLSKDEKDSLNNKMLDEETATQKFKHAKK